MKTYSERTTSILNKAKIKRRQRNTVLASVSTALCIIFVFSGIALFTPYDTTPPSMEKYAASEYYAIIEKLNVLTYKEPIYKNAFEEHILSALQGVGKGFNQNLGMTPEMSPDIGFDKEDSFEGEVPNDSQASSENTMAPGSSEKYEEVTDNQVEGVIESDIFKRSDKYIYYLRGCNLYVYSIAGEDSKEIGHYEIADQDGYKIGAYGDSWDMFLSKDCKTITLISSVYNQKTSSANVMLVSLDVSDPTAIKENQRSYLTGEYLSSRMVDNELLVMAHYNARWHEINFSDETTFIPQYGTSEDMKCIEAENIVCPDTLTSTNYTVVCKIDGTTLEATSTGAFLSYANEVYVSANKIYATRTYTSETTGDDGVTCSKRMTEISALDYSGETMSYAGTVSVAGTIENQYYLDEYNGILRIVTTTNTDTYISHQEEHDDMVAHWIEEYRSSTNASLYCIDLNTWQVVASVEGFAPEGETVESVRFDGNYAYVCTAVVVTMTDPVFYFDLTDLNNITYKDTGDISGYSSSLVNFGDYLLGIGFGDSSETLKIEMYQETATGVESVCVYEVKNCDFSTEYKSYLIDRANSRIGLGYTSFENGYTGYYMLLQFDGYRLVPVVQEYLYGIDDYKRAVIIDEYIYMFSNDVIQNFVVKKL